MDARGDRDRSRCLLHDAHLELESRDYVNAEVRRELEPRLPARTKKSIELKWCNVSAVLDEADLPWVSGHKPLPHYQRKLRSAVDGWLQRNPKVHSRLRN